LRAAATARLTSSAVESGAVAIASPVAGLITSTVPLWLFLPIAAFALWSLLDRLLSVKQWPVDLREPDDEWFYSDQNGRPIGPVSIDALIAVLSAEERSLPRW
jgi:hypothetical protein